MTINHLIYALSILICISFSIVTADIDNQFSINPIATLSVETISQTLATNYHINLSNLTYVRTDEKASGSVYALTTSDITYYVNTKTGNIDSALFLDPDPIGKVEIGWNEAEKKGIEYAHKYYSNFSAYNMTFYSKFLNVMQIPTYGFTWYEFKDGVRLPNYFAVELSAVNGQIISYNSDDVPIQVVNLKPSITKEQAEKLARQKWANVNLSNFTSVLAINYIAPEKQALVWEVSGEGSIDAGVTNIGFGDILLVDAINGSILPYFI